MLKFTAHALNRTNVDLVTIPVCEDADLHDDEQLRALIAKAFALEEFSGEKGQQIMLFDLPDTRIRRCLFIGMGPLAKLDAEALRTFGGRAVKAAAAAKCKRTALVIPGGEKAPLELTTAARAIAEGAFLGTHTFELYKSKPKPSPVEHVELWVPAVPRGFDALAKEVEIVCSGTLKAREWVSMPSNEKTPILFARAVSGWLPKAGLKVAIRDAAWLKREKFGALLAVGAGSAHPPCLVEIVYAPKGAGQTIVVVGKGVTFDTGGINIKPSAGLETMKSDMSGAAAAAALMSLAALLKPAKRIVALLPLVENMPSGTATRPGDIVTTYAGKTVEIGNTDAEGRLILADALAYAVKKHKPDILMDMATLTGACVVALGEKLAGVFSADDQLAHTVVEAGRATFERCWRMPLPEDYKELLKSDLADIGNMPSTRYGGAITAALFLSEFVGETRWAHIDIAGPAFAKKGNEYCGSGGSGFGVRLLWETIAQL